MIERLTKACLVRFSQKAELHVHTSGSISPKFMLKMGRQIDWADTKYPKIQELQAVGKGFGVNLNRIFRKRDLTTLRKLLEHTDGKEGLDGYLKRMTLGHRLLHNNLPAWEALAYDIAVSSYRKSKVTYLELRFPVIKPPLDPKAIIEAIHKGLLRAERKYPRLKTAMIVCTMKPFSSAQTQEIVNRMLELREKPEYKEHLVGIDTAGPEVYQDAQGKDEVFDHYKFKDSFDKARAGGIGVVDHAGEQFLSLEDGLEAIRKSVEVLGAARIGHALALGINPGSLINTVDGYGKVYGLNRVQDLAVRQNALTWFLTTQGVTIEACLSSNMQTQPALLPNIASHPLGEWIKSRLPVTLATDNLTTSDTTLTREYLMAAKAFDLTFEQISGMLRCGFESKLT